MRTMLVIEEYTGGGRFSHGTMVEISTSGRRRAVDMIAGATITEKIG